VITVIIPAYNEANVIGATLDALLPGTVVGDIEIIVICNACTDNTVAIVRKYGGRVKCLESPVASKTNALNLGDREATGFPRIYLDADVVLSFDAVQKISAVLQNGRYLAAAPKMKMDFTTTSWAVKSYYDVWQQLPYVREGMIGTGAYALSQEGKNKVGDFPDIIADDGYVRAMFSGDERISVDDCYSLIRAPSNLYGLMKIKMRSRLGRYELAEKFPHLLKNEQKNYKFAFLKLLTKVNCWLKIPVYIYVNMVTRVRARKYFQLHKFTGWERDETSRYNINPKKAE